MTNIIFFRWTNPRNMIYKGNTIKQVFNPIRISSKSHFSNREKKTYLD